MKKLILFLTLFWIIPVPVDARASRSGTTHSLIFASSQGSLTKVGSTFWASGGAGVVELGLSSSPITNPATLSFSSMMLHVEFGKQFAAKWICDFDYNDQFVLPSFVSIGKPINEEYRMKFVPGDTTYDPTMPRYNPFKDYPLLFDPPQHSDSTKAKKKQE